MFVVNALKTLQNPLIFKNKMFVVNALKTLQNPLIFKNFSLWIMN